MMYWTLFPLVIGIVVLGVTAGIAYAVSCRPSYNLKDAAGAEAERRHGAGRRTERDIKKISGSAQVSATRLTLSKRLYRAGYFTERSRKQFIIWHAASLLCWTGGCAAFAHFVLSGAAFVVMFGVLGLLIGYIMPLAWLDRCARIRRDELMYYLPLVIEQVSIGVSSSLDIGPCISHIINTARERRSHNPVTALFVHAEKLIRSGLNFDSALLEVADAVDLPEVRHAFMFLVQCSKHGGEVSKQLQELADSVMMQRQIQIEAKIAALPVKATGPLATVFAGFFGLLFAGLFVRIATAFG